jgi:16S rRNA (guanine1207-N2)-methyltransferase
LVTLRLRDCTFDLATAPGLFSPARIDPGTQVLLDSVPDPPATGDLIDLGCGYGPIALAVAHRAPRTRVWAVDVDDVALELTEQNAAAHGLRNVHAVTPRQVPTDVGFAALYANPPYRIGRGPLQRILARWLDRLDAGSHGFIVIKQSHGADSIAAWLTESGYPTQRVRSKIGYRLLRCTSA